MQLSFRRVRKQFADLPVIDDFTQEMADGELLALIGPSGCGKSTLLHLAAGLEKPSSGCVLADGREIRGPDPARMLMFQENALYPWLSLVGNVALALELQGVPKRTAREQARLWLGKVELQGFDDYYPHQVSGGMRQRVALARAFISHPKVLLLDEPFGALDALTRMTLQDSLLDLVQELSPTVLLVTHDVDEALFLADRILVFSKRPARLIREFRPGRRSRSHDVRELGAMRAEILDLLGVGAGSNRNIQEEMAA